MRQSDRRLRRPLVAAFAIGAAWSISSSRATAGEIDMADNAAKPAAAGPFASKSEAFLDRALPAATAANPKYRSPSSDIETRWLTKKIRFRDREEGGVVVSTAEAIEDYRTHALSAQRTHAATFAVDDVAISEETADDLAENGEKARGVLFTCVVASRPSGVGKNRPAPRLTFTCKTRRSDGKSFTRSGRASRSPHRPDAIAPDRLLPADTGPRKRPWRSFALTTLPLCWGRRKAHGRGERQTSAGAFSSREAALFLARFGRGEWVGDDFGPDGLHAP
jgi:hypothetical protein